MRVNSSLLANLIGQGWTAFLNLAAVPLYLHFLGVDAFGLVGLYTVVLVIVSLLDAGMTTTLNREMVRYIAGERSRAQTHDLLRSIEIVLGAVGIALILGAVVAGPVLAHVWITRSTIAVDIISFCLTMMIIASVLRVFEAIYRAALLGLHRPILMNGLLVASSSIRIIGVFGAFVLGTADLNTFFWWQVATGVLTLMVFAFTTHAIVGVRGRSARFDATLLQDVQRFAGGAFAVSVLGIALTQLDKVVVARLVPLRDLGYYSAAVVVATGIYQIVLPLFHSFYPRLSFLHATGDRAQFGATYQRGAKLVAVVAGPPIAVAMCFAHDVLLVWTGNVEVALAAAPLLQLLGPGALAYGLYHLPLAALLASGTQRVAVRAALAALLLLLPGIAIGFATGGIAGVAGAWSMAMIVALILNLAGIRRALLADVPIGHLLKSSLGPVGIAFALSGLALLLPPVGTQGRIAAAATIAAIGAAVLLLTALLTWGPAHPRFPRWNRV